MPSPFPGMNPYLECDEIWRDFHISFLSETRNVLNAGLAGSNFFAKLEEQIYIHEPEAHERELAGFADVGVFQREPELETASGTLAVVNAPFRVRIPATMEERQPFIEIREKASRELVAVIELLSPSNKRLGSDRDQFLAKRSTVLQGTAHYLEIDLLRAGPRLPVENFRECSYYMLLSRVEDRPDAGFWPIQLRERLPKIVLPLRGSHPGVFVDFQEVLHRTYDHAGYGQILDDLTIDPPFSEEDVQWAETIRQSAQTH